MEKTKSLPSWNLHSSGRNRKKQVYKLVNYIRLFKYHTGNKNGTETGNWVGALNRLDGRVLGRACDEEPRMEKRLLFKSRTCDPSRGNSKCKGSEVGVRLAY